MKWTKRLKWIRLSKIIIPIALAISLVFAGFSVYANKAENFVVNIKNSNGIELTLTLDETLKPSSFTTTLHIPVRAPFDNVSFVPYDKAQDYDGDTTVFNPDVYEHYKPGKFANNLPNDIAQQEADDLANKICDHSVILDGYRLAFLSFSFYLVNVGKMCDVDMKMTIDSAVHKNNKNGEHHIEDAIRVMFIEGKPLLTDETYTVYKRKEATEAEEALLANTVYYKNVADFYKANVIFNRVCEGYTEEDTEDIEGALGMGIANFPKYNPELGVDQLGVRRFTVIVWLEGHDPDCVDQIKPESLKMSLEFEGR